MSWRNINLLAVGVLTALVISACGQAAAVPRTNSVHIAAPEAGASPVAVNGGTPGEDQLLKEIVDGMSPSDIVSVGIAGPPVTAPNVSESSVWLQVVHPASSTVAPADLARGRWEGLVVASAYLEKCQAAGVPCIQGAQMLGPSGSVDGDFAGLVKIDNDDQSPSSSDAAVAAALETAADAAGLSAVSVSFEDAAGFSVPVVTAVSADPASFVQSYRSLAIFGDSPPFAAFLEVTDQSGSPVYAEGLSAATEQGVAWTKPGLNPNNLGSNSGHA